MYKSDQLPSDIQHLIDRLFPTPDPHYKVTHDAQCLWLDYQLDSSQWTHASFMKMAQDKNWAPRTVDHRWAYLGVAALAPGGGESARPAAPPAPVHEPVFSLQRAADSARSDLHELELQIDQLSVLISAAGWESAAKSLDAVVQRGSLVSFRLALEQMLIALGADLGHNFNLSDAIRLIGQKDRTLERKMQHVKDLGNDAAHLLDISWDTVMQGLYAMKDVVNTLSQSRGPASS